ncbi:MAG: helix-turn-helix domain-containing protein [Limisphaerales bacterium]
MPCYAWHNDSCFPGQNRLAQDMGMTRPRVTQWITELETAGLVTIQRHRQGKTKPLHHSFSGRKPG